VETLRNIRIFDLGCSPVEGISSLADQTLATPSRGRPAFMDEKLTVVVVDDSSTARALFLEIAGQHPEVQIVGTASDGAEAVLIVAKSKPDLVVMDIVMPNLDGLAALRILRNRVPGTRIAMVSSLGGSPARAEEAFRLGAVQVIAKPFDASQLDALFAAERSAKTERKSQGGRS
jgi:chemotaxis response regulator CheB